MFLKSGLFASNRLRHLWKCKSLAPSLTQWIRISRNGPRNRHPGDSDAQKRLKWSALAGVAQWIECQPKNQRVTGLIPSLGHMLGLWARSPVGGAHERQPHIDVSFPLSKKKNVYNDQWEFALSDIHSFSSQTFIEHVLHIMLDSRLWEYSSK